MMTRRGVIFDAVVYQSVEFAYLSTGWSGCGSVTSEHAYGWNSEWLDAD